MDSSQELFYQKVRYFLFLVENGNYTFKTNIKLPSEVLHDNLYWKTPTIVENFLIASESGEQTEYSEEQIKKALVDEFKLCDCFDWCDSFIHPFINLDDLDYMLPNAKKYIMSHIFMEMEYYKKGNNNINYGSGIYNYSKYVSFDEQIEIMEFMCKYGYHSQIGYIKELTYLNDTELYDDYSIILKKNLPWTNLN